MLLPLSILIALTILANLRAEYLKDKYLSKGLCLSQTWNLSLSQLSKARYNPENALHRRELNKLRKAHLLHLFFYCLAVLSAVSMIFYHYHNYFASRYGLCGIDPYL